jgi:hypothetical protein
VKPEHREEAWEWISKRAYYDELHGSDVLIVNLARPLTMVYGLGLADADGRAIEASIPELRRFLAFLTQVDPLFPSWEFVFVGGLQDQMLHPRYKAKLARYYEQWKRFKAQEGSPNTPEKTPRVE